MRHSAGAAWLPVHWAVRLRHAILCHAMYQALSLPCLCWQQQPQVCTPAPSVCCLPAL
jgi:hypothetical protein